MVALYDPSPHHKEEHSKMNKRLFVSLLTGICLSLLASAVASADHLLVKDVLNNGGGHVESASYLLDYSVGQVAIGRSMGSSYVEWAGFWGWSLWEPFLAAEGETQQFLPTTYALQQNYPNPFNPQTCISYQLPRAVHVSLVVFNVKGQVVCQLVDEYQASGEHLVTWNGTDQSGCPVSSGVYFYRLCVADFQEMRKMLLLK
jgi:hypothetical protein